MRNPASGGLRARLAKLAAIPAVGLIIAACTEQANQNPTGDDAAPNLFGETANGIGFPHEVVTTEGIASAGLYLPIFLIAVAIFVLVEGLLLLLVLRYRKRSSGADLPEQTHGNNKLEFIWTAIPMAIVFVLFVVSTNVLMNDVEARSDEHGAVVDVQAFRFGWIFDYQDPASSDREAGDYEPAGVTVSGGGRENPPTMVVPVGEPVLIRLTAADVIHSWYVPSFFFKRDAIPGRTNEFEITVEQPGVYGGQCAEFCGLAHGDMYFSVDAREPAAYDEWLAEQTAGATTETAGGGATEPGTEATESDGAAESGSDAATESDGAAESGATDASAPEAAAGSAPPASAVLELATTADRSIAFTTSELEATAGETVTLVYTNDSNVPHNVVVFDSEDSDGARLAETGTITGPGETTEVTFTVPSEPGAYFFYCELHPMQMTGTLTVTP